MKHPSACLLFALLFAFTSAPAFAQDDGIGIGPRGASVFAEVSGGSVGQGEGIAWGGSGGGYFQGHLLGFIARASALPSNANNRIYNAVVGPRFAMTLPWVRVFLEAGGGMGHSGFYNSQGVFGTSLGAAWQVDAGVSHGILPRVDWRILEVGYGHIYVGPGGVSPVIASTGLTLHIW